MAIHTQDQLDRTLDAFAALRSHRRRPSPRVRVDEVGATESLRPFIDLAWQVNRQDPAWVPPLRRDLRVLLDRSRHPFHRHADVASFVARRNGDVVGRIGAIVNHRHNDYHRDRTGFFGFFEAIEDPPIAAALLDAAGAWLRERGLERMVGPSNFSTNEACGLLVDGFECPPAVMMPHNPAYYARLLEQNGMQKEKDLLAYRLDCRREPPLRLRSTVTRLQGRDRRGFRIRPLALKRLPEEIAIVRALYHAAWGENWGFVPMTAAEFDHMARDLRQVVDPDLCLIAEQSDGQPVGFSITLPDVNQALRGLDGRLFPLGFLRFLVARRRIDHLRILTLGVHPRFRGRGIDAALYLETWLVSQRKGYRTAEASWILEDNWPMRRAVERMGGHCFRTYRMYGRAV